MSIETYGDYQLLKKLATGGMAQIFLARQQGMEGFEKFLVVKRILPHLAENDDFIKMFLDEARIAARLNHPNIVQIFNLGAQDDSYFIAMEFIHGEDVRRVWKRADSKNKPIPVPLVARIIMDACGGLDYAHKKVDSQGKPLNIVHRDISPQNILVTFEGGVKVVDFGIAKAADQATVTKSGVLKGKYSYMSPEQASGLKIDRRSDIFALGVVLYELTTGTRLFKRTNDIQTLNAVTECVVVPPSEINERLPKDFDPIVMKALAKRPEDRYQEAIAFQAALENWVLQNKFPSSSVQLAAFMQDIYAERLAQEAEEGRILIEGLDASKNEASKNGEERATPISKAGRLAPTASLKAIDPRPRVDDDNQEATIAQRPARGGSVSGAISKPRTSDRALAAPPPLALDDDRGGATVTSTETRAGGKPLVWVAALAVVSGLAVSAWMVIANAPRAEVVVASEPSNAAVRFDGRLLASCTTPCTLPEVQAGEYSLSLTRAGYQELKTRIEIPARGRVRLPAFTLQPAVKDPVGVSPEVDAGPAVAVAPQPVTFSVKSNPPGAQLLVDGKSRGVTPASFEVTPGTVVGVSLKLPGYREFSDSFQISEPGERTISLEKREPAATHVNPPPKKEFGMVRFIVKPWASVQCGAFKLGDTPFADKQLPAGSYECTFSNPEFPEKKQAVVVKPNETIRVSVNF
ncbi:MAG: serine/threonine protein kinase [Myxococcaceae bacterium]|nr:serine/threonine protein kinase [Myxococcaceae bacterium]